ncbi:MFS transporter [Deinococcus budaensis]|uniref:Putative MFS family arabinose efflux permease n=1 Tax=Deinococcus budaensis TaxID=1665626 RepID=A0A7W8LPT9_9DEIO|nr:MFS transporter [Deinococcus budaensis]MBB5234111.1 putative MFS family arabinose efflux permease [Deinococcus budaensis]
MAQLSVGQRSLVGALAVLTTVGYGALYYAQPLLAVAVEQERGWTRAQTGLAFTLALLVSAFLAPLVGRALDEKGGRKLLSLGALSGSLAFLLLAFTSSSLPFVFGWLLAGVAMALVFYEAAFTVLGQQMQGAARTRATLTITLVAGLASTIFVPLTTASLGHFGLRGTFLGLAALLLLMVGVAWWGIPAGERPDKVQTTPQAFQPDRRFHRLTLAFTLARVVTVGIGLQLAPMLLAAGENPALAATLTGLLGLAALPGRVLFVSLLGRVGAWRLTRALCLQLALGSLLLCFRDHLAPIVLGIIVFGLASGALTLARAEVLTQGYPAQMFGAANGHLARPVNLAQALTPLGMGLLLTFTGDCVPSLLLLALLGLGAAWMLGGGSGNGP